MGNKISREKESPVSHMRDVDVELQSSEPALVSSVSQTVPSAIQAQSQPAAPLETLFTTPSSSHQLASIANADIISIAKATYPNVQDQTAPSVGWTVYFKNQISEWKDRRRDLKQRKLMGKVRSSLADDNEKKYDWTFTQYCKFRGKKGAADSLATQEDSNTTYCCHSSTFLTRKKQNNINDEAQIEPSSDFPSAEAIVNTSSSIEMPITRSTDKPPFSGTDAVVTVPKESKAKKDHLQGLFEHCRNILRLRSGQDLSSQSMEYSQPKQARVFSDTDRRISVSVETWPSASTTQTSKKHNLRERFHQYCHKLRQRGASEFGSQSPTFSQSSQEVAASDADTTVSGSMEASPSHSTTQTSKILREICRQYCIKLRRGGALEIGSPSPTFSQFSQEIASSNADATVSGSMETSPTATKTSAQHFVRDLFSQCCIKLLRRAALKFGSQSPMFSHSSQEIAASDAVATVSGSTEPLSSSSITKASTKHRLRELFSQYCIKFRRHEALEFGSQSPMSSQSSQEIIVSDADATVSESMETRPLPLITKTSKNRKERFSQYSIKLRQRGELEFHAQSPTSSETSQKLSLGEPDSTVSGTVTNSRPLRQSNSINLPVETWMLIVTINKHSLKEIADYSRTSRFLRAIFWNTVSLKARLMIEAKFGCLGITNEVTLERNAYAILKAATPLSSGKALKPVKSIAVDGNMDSASFNNLRMYGLMENNFERMWTRAACEAGNFEVLNLLRDLEFTSYHSLHTAARSDDAYLCQILLENGYNVNDVTEDDERNTPLHVAARYGSLTVAKLLVDHGAEIQSCNIGGMTPLHEAVETSQIKIIRFLLSTLGPKHEFVKTTKTSIERLNAAGQNCLIGGRLFNNGKAITRRTIKKMNSRITPVMTALRIDCKASFSCFLEMASDDDEHLLMQMACEVGAIKCVEVLLARGAAVEPVESRFESLGFQSSSATVSSQKQLYTSVISKNDWTPLSIAIMNTQDKLAEFFVDIVGCSVNCSSKYGQTPFYIAAGEVGNVAMAKFLLSRNANWNIRQKVNQAYTSSRPGFSALHRAVQKKKFDAIRFLVDLWGPEWQVKQYQAHSLEIKQIKTSNLEPCARLPSCMDDDGSNPVHIAVQYLKFMRAMGGFDNLRSFTLYSNTLEDILRTLLSVRPDWVGACDKRCRTPYQLARRWLPTKPELEPALGRFRQILNVEAINI
ncbi:hypothetical protein HDU76_003163 [Blyttiomyces sp. JEL0837]|nr:hypothetical protein HDU76_003163 [Blyttiomyces sp. JEL0837]